VIAPPSLHLDSAGVSVYAITVTARTTVLWLSVTITAVGSHRGAIVEISQDDRHCRSQDHQDETVNSQSSSIDNTA